MNRISLSEGVLRLISRDQQRQQPFRESSDRMEKGKGLPRSRRSCQCVEVEVERISKRQLEFDCSF